MKRRPLVQLNCAPAQHRQLRVDAKRRLSAGCCRIREKVARLEPHVRTLLIEADAGRVTAIGDRFQLPFEKTPQ